MTIKIILADDHQIVRQGLRTLLACEPDMKVVGEADNGRSTLGLAEELAPDVIIMDISMPGLNGIEATRELHKQLPECRVIVHSSHNEPEIIAAAFGAGASGYLIKGSSQSLISSIRSVIRHVSAHDDAPYVNRVPEHAIPRESRARQESSWGHL